MSCTWHSMFSCWLLSICTSYSNLLRSSWRILVSSLFTTDTWGEKNQRWTLPVQKGLWTERVIVVLRCRTVTSWNTRTGHVPKSLNYPKGTIARARQSKVQDKFIHTEGLLAEVHSLSEWRPISNQLRGKTKVFWGSGRNYLDWFNLSTLTTETPNQASCFTVMSLR